MKRTFISLMISFFLLNSTIQCNASEGNFIIALMAAMMGIPFLSTISEEPSQDCNDPTKVLLDLSPAKAQVAETVIEQLQRKHNIDDQNYTLEELKSLYAATSTIPLKVPKHLK